MCNPSPSQGSLYASRQIFIQLTSEGKTCGVPGLLVPQAAPRSAVCALAPGSADTLTLVLALLPRAAGAHGGALGSLSCKRSPRQGWGRGAVRSLPTEPCCDSVKYPPGPCSVGCAGAQCPGRAAAGLWFGAQCQHLYLCFSGCWDDCSQCLSLEAMESSACRPV